MNEWFKKITVKEYDNLIKNKNKMYNISKNFTSPELMNKYRDEDQNINEKIEINEQQLLQNENLSKVFDKYFNEKEDVTIYSQDYPMNNMNDIVMSLNKIFNKYKISYKPRKNSIKVKINYLLGKLEKNKNINDNLFKYFDDNIRNLKKLNHELYFNENDKLYNRENILMEPNNTTSDIDIDTLSNLNIVPIQKGQGVLNNIKIDKNSLNKNILKIRYLNGRKLNNKLLKHDYKISKNMKDAIKFNKNIHKLSSNEKNIYYELEKYINKDKPLDVLIGSYLSGNNNKKLYNRINKILYNKYKNNLITYKEYTNLLNKINIT